MLVAFLSENLIRLHSTPNPRQLSICSKKNSETKLLPLRVINLFKIDRSNIYLEDWPEANHLSIVFPYFSLQDMQDL